MDKEQPAPPKQAKIIDEFPTMIGSGEHDATTDFSRYELDSHFSIYKVGEDKQPEKETKEKDFDIDDPNAFLIQSDIVGGDNRHYVDLDFDLNQSTKPTNPIASFDPKPSISQSTTTEETSIPKETFTKNLNDEDSFSENLKAGQIDNLFDEKPDLIDMSASIISQSENSSFSDNIDFPSSTVNVESKPSTLESTTGSSMSEDPDLSTPTISQSQSIENSTINFELSSHMEMSTGFDMSAANSSSSSNNTKIEAFKPEQTNLDSSTILSSSNVEFKPYSPEESKFIESVQHQDLSKMLDISANDDVLISSVGQHSSVPDDDFVTETHFEPNIIQPEEDIISKYLDTSLVPPTIPEEDFVEEVSTSFSSSVYLEKLPEALQAEQVTLPDSNHESDYDVDNSNLINSFSDIIKEQSKLSDNTSTSSSANETVIGTGLAHGLSSIETITEAKTIDVQPGYVEEFVIDPSPAQQFVEEPVQLKQESLADELSWSSSSYQQRNAVEDQFHAEEAPFLAASAPVLSTFALPQQKQFELASSLDSVNASSDPINVDNNLVQQKVDSLVASNTAPSEISAQVYTDEHYSNILQPAAVDLKNDLSANVLVDDIVAQPVASTTTSSAPVASSLSPAPSPPPSPTANIATESTQLYEEYTPFVPPQQHNYPQEQQQTQPEHEDIISATSSTNLLHTSSPANIVDQQQQQVLSALEEETEEEELREQEKKSWSRDNKEEEAASAPEAQEVVASKKNADTTEQWSSSSSASTLQSAAIAATTVEPNTRPALSLSSSPAPDTSSTTKMGRKNNQFRRENSNDDQNLGPDQLKEFIQGILGVNVAELVYWRDPRNTGVVFGIGLVILLSLSIFSVISVVAYTLLFTLLGTLSFRVYKNVLQAVQKTNEGHPFKEYLEVEIAPSTERINEIVEQLVSHGTCFVKRMRSVLLVEDIVDSLKYLLIFWALTYIGAWFNGLTLVILSYISAFSLPKVYELNKAQIDQYLDLVNSKLTELSDKVPFLKKVPVEKKEE